MFYISRYCFIAGSLLLLVNSCDNSEQSDRVPDNSSAGTAVHVSKGLDGATPRYQEKEADMSGVAKETEEYKKQRILIHREQLLDQQQREVEKIQATK